MNRLHIKITKSLLVSVLLTISIITIIYGINGTLPGGRRTFISGDALVQYVPIIKLFLRKLIKGDSLLYSFEIGMGMPTVALYAYYCLSPFNILFLIVDDLDVACYLVYTVKLTCASVAMTVLLQKTRNIPILSSAVFSNAYVLCGFVLNFSYGLIFLDMFILMPIILLAMNRFIKTGKWGGLCCVYALSFMIHFYSAYIIGIFSFVVFADNIWFVYGKKTQRIKDIIIKYFLCLFLAILISGPIIIPVAIELFTHIGTDSTIIGNFRTSMIDFVSGFFPGVSQKAYNSIPFMYSGIIPIMILLLIFLNKRMCWKKKIFIVVPLLFLSLCCFWRPAYLMIHAFDAPDGYCYRFSWLFGFWIIYVVAGDYDSVVNSKKKTVIVVVTAISVCMLAILWKIVNRSDQNSNELIYMYVFIIIGLYIIVLFVFHKKDIRNVILIMNIFIIGETAINGVIVENNFVDDVTRDGAYYQIWREQFDIALKSISESEADENTPFYRIHYGNGVCDNVSMLYGYHGLGWFLTIENERVRMLMDALGYATSPRKAEDYGSTQFTRMLFSQKYSIECSSYFGGHPEQFSISKNSEILPPFFMVSDLLAGYDIKKGDPFLAQVDLAQAMTGKRFSFWNKKEDKYQILKDGANLYTIPNGFLLKRDINNVNGKIWFCFEDEDEENLYVYISSKEKSADDIRAPLVFSEMDAGGLTNAPRLTCPHIMPIAKNSIGKWEFYILMQESGYVTSEYDELYASSFDEKEFMNCFNELNSGSQELTYISDTEWRGQIQSTKECPILLTTIPYDQGWNIYVDGDKVEKIALLNGAFIGARLSPGVHDICILYNNVWIHIGNMIGIIGIIILGVIFGLKRTHGGFRPTKQR